jgi:hypothetical protein
MRCDGVLDSVFLNSAVTLTVPLEQAADADCDVPHARATVALTPMMAEANTATMPRLMRVAFRSARFTGASLPAADGTRRRSSPAVRGRGFR